MKPLFMWAGGKTKMLRHYAPLMDFERMETYSEPFFGGGAVFLHVSRNWSPRKVWINDINADIMAIYRAIRNEPVLFMREMDSYQSTYMPMSKEDRKKFYYELRTAHAENYERYEQTPRAALLYFLMKTAFNGIWQVNANTNGRFGTPSGLLNQKDAVYDRENVEAWNRLLRSMDVEIMDGDWSCVPVSDFTFMDPPYRDSFADYGNGFPDDELRKIVAVVEQNRNAWLCNRDCGDGFFDGVRATVHRFPVTYTAGRRKRTENGFAAKKATEILLFNK